MPETTRRAVLKRAVIGGLVAAALAAKPAAEAKKQYDFCTGLTQLSGTDAYRPLHEGGCPLAGREG